MQEIVALQKHWKSHLAELLSDAKSDVLITAPYITQAGTAFVQQNLSESVRLDGRLTILTDLSPVNVAQGSTDPNALLGFFQMAPQVQIFHLPRLHAKVYVADAERAVVTSGNLTAGGLNINYEYGLDVTHLATVEAVRYDLSQYTQLGVKVSEDELSLYSQIAEEVKATYQQQQKAVTKSARKSFEEALQKANDGLIKLRLAEGPIHTVFSKTILYLLRKEGLLTTQQLHLLIQQLHPDLCDDSVDRVIDGRHFGKKWKHAVRTAQQHLKKDGAIELTHGQWTLI